jgi:environmental stress-induced protein Ves
MASNRNLLQPSDFKRTPWKNGLGWTDQIAIYPETAELKRGNFDWRVSTARVAQSAPFSPFADHDRILVVLEGVGVKLSHSFEESEEPECVDVPPWEPYEFPGDVPTRCDLLNGPIQDFSVFVRKGVVSAKVDTVAIAAEEPFEWTPLGRTCFIFVAEGALDADGTAMEKGQVLKIDREQDPSPAHWALSSERARILIVELG